MASHYPKPSSEPVYTVFIRLPFPRGDFVDPPPVTVDFLLQQVAFLTERHASQLRAQMRKAAAAVRDSPMPSPQPGAESPFLAEMLRRTGSAGSGQPRAPSALTIRKDSPLPRNDNGSVPGTPAASNSPRPATTRTSSSNTAVVTTRNLGGGAGGVGGGKAAAAATANRSSAETQRNRLSSLPIATAVDEVDADPPSPEPAEEASSAASSSSSSSSPAQSRIIRRPPRFQSNDASSSFADDDDDDDDDDEDAEPAFLPYNPPPPPPPPQSSDGSSSGQHDLSATLRGNPRDFARRLPKGSSAGRGENFHHSQTSDSSASSAAVFVQGSSDRDRDRNRPGVPMSPRRTMELAGRSPGAAKGKAYSRDSDGTPSMGSSFSDLDGILSLLLLSLTWLLNWSVILTHALRTDASVTQSALEEALASNMGDAGTIGSLRGTISNAFRSRYLPKSNNP